MIAEHAIDWTAQWREQGRKEGRKQGRKEGRKEGEAALLLRQLRHKFGPLDSAIEDRVNRTDAAQLLEWGDRVLSASTLDEVLNGRGD